jgi:signal peptidase I
MSRTLESVPEEARITSARRALAIVLSLPFTCVGSGGLGHFVLGRFRRGIVAFTAVSAALFGAMLLLPKLGAVAMLLWPVAWLGVVIDVASLRSDGRPLPNAGKILGGYAALVAASVAFALVIRTTLVEAFKIPAGSMMPTLMIGDHVFVDKHAYGLFSRSAPARGDVVVFKFPENPSQDFVKRVIALPGDRLEAINGRPILNGKLVPHCRVGQFSYEGRTAELFVEFLDSASYLTLFDDDPDTTSCSEPSHCACREGICGVQQGPFGVAPGEVWVMGDNRDNSHDSRTWRGGLGAGVPLENIKGKAGMIWMSFGPAGNVASERIGLEVSASPQLPGATKALTSALADCLRTRGGAVAIR